MKSTAARNLTDAELVASCLSGEPAAWETLVERYGRLVYSIARKNGLADDVVDDVFQNVFRILLQKLNQIQEPDRLSAWLISITHRECWRFRRRNAGQAAMHGSADHLGAPPPPLQEPAHEAIVWERRREVRDGLEALGEPCRTLLERLFFNVSTASYETISAELGMKVGSIGPTRARCLAKLRTLLLEAGWDPDEVG